MGLIIVPRVLTGLLREVGREPAKQLALSYAEHALRECRTVLNHDQLEVSLAYLAAARDVVGGTGQMDVLAQAHSNFFATRADGHGVPEKIMWIAVNAVQASCQREMERAGVVHRSRWMPDALDIARSAQDAVGLSVGGEGRAAVHAARWEEARWQLIHLIETVPIPA